MNTGTPDMQNAIDAEYARLEEFDPEIRNGLVERPFHNKNQREGIRRRTEAYNARCLEFRNFCERIVLQIVQITPPKPEERALEEELLIA